MLCCRGPACVDELDQYARDLEKREMLIKDSRANQQQLQQHHHQYHQQQHHQQQQHHRHHPHQPSVPTRKPNVVQRSQSAVVRGSAINRPNNHRIQNMVKENPLLVNPQIRHVTNIQKDIHVKLYGVMKSSPSRGTGYYESSYKVVQIPKPLNAPKVQVVSRSQSARESRSSNLHKRTTTPVNDKNNPRLSNEISIPAIDDDCDNLSDKQKDVLDELDDPINKFQPDDTDDSEMPKIIADVLPYGEFQPFNMDNVFHSDSGVDSNGSSSRTSSVSDKSISSRTGIISKRISTENGKRKVNSVSFQLPEGHKDKPYSPMQNSQKQRDNNSSSALIVVSGDKVGDWQTNELARQELARRNSTGPFKGSFMQLFYKKYGDNNVGVYGDHARYLTPKIMEKIESFENLSPRDMARVNIYRGNPAPSLTRRHTFR